MKVFTTLLGLTALFATAHAGCMCYKTEEEQAFDLSEKCCGDIEKDYRELDEPEGGPDDDGYLRRTHECASVGDKIEDFKMCCNQDDTIAWCFGDDFEGSEGDEGDE